MKFTLNNELKKKSIERVIHEFESELIVRLTILNIDLDDFDADNFIPDENSTAQKDIFEIINKIKKHTEQLNSLN